LTVSKAKSNATIVDIARRANVTNITVSRAFNKPELLKPETLEKIGRDADLVLLYSLPFG